MIRKSCLAVAFAVALAVALAAGVPDPAHRPADRARHPLSATTEGGRRMTPMLTAPCPARDAPSAAVVSDPTKIVGLSDQRVQCATSGSGLGFLLKAGDMMQGRVVVTNNGATITATGCGSLFAGRAMHDAPASRLGSTWADETA